MISHPKKLYERSEDFPTSFLIDPTFGPIAIRVARLMGASRFAFIDSATFLIADGFKPVTVLEISVFVDASDHCDIGFLRTRAGDMNRTVKGRKYAGVFGIAQTRHHDGFRDRGKRIDRSLARERIIKGLLAVFIVTGNAGNSNVLWSDDLHKIRAS